MKSAFMRPSQLIQFASTLLPDMQCLRSFFAVALPSPALISDHGHFNISAVAIAAGQAFGKDSLSRVKT
jgi:hypothetical protein